MDKSTADLAAKWWADHLRNGAKLDNGDEQIDAFEFELSVALLCDVARGGRVMVGVDYHPDRILQEAADRAELPLSMSSLPWKTTMWIKDDVVTVSHGYGAPVEELQHA